MITTPTLPSIPIVLVFIMARSSDSNFLVALFRDKTFQAREIRRVVVLTFAYLAITTIMVGLFYHQMLGRLLDGMAPLLFVSEDMALANEAVPTLGSVLGTWLTAMLAVNAVITICLSVYITRKLGHPILAIKRSLREIGNGNLDVRLRASDNREFSELATELTTAMQSIRKQISAAKNGIEKVTGTDAITTDPEQMSQALNDCRHALDYFQVDDQRPKDNSKAA